MSAATASPSSGGVSVCGRLFSQDDLDVIRRIISAEPALNRRQIATETCSRLGWIRPNGRLKEMSCRVALLRLEKCGHIRLPPPLKGNGNGKRYRPGREIEEPSGPLVATVRELGELRVVPLRRGTHRSNLWNEAVARFHYLGYKPLAGAQIRYLVESDAGLLGALSFGASAWKVAPRDKWIGWSPEARKASLHLVVNNARFLILPWVRCPNLASRLLGLCVRRIPEDWMTRYGYCPVLLETFVERERFAGTCYKAAGWQYVGDTQGRGKLDRYAQYPVPVKRIMLRPLRTDFRETLCG